MEITSDTKLTNEVKVYGYCIRKDYNIPKIFEIFEGSVWENGYFAIYDEKARNYYVQEYARKFTSYEEAEENFKLGLKDYFEELEVEFQKGVEKLRKKY